MMEKRVGVLHRGKLAQYSISEGKNGSFIARLLSYSGPKGDDLPEELEVHKAGRHWEDQGADQDLVDDIGMAIEQENRVPEKPIYLTRGNGDNDRYGPTERNQNRNTG